MRSATLPARPRPEERPGSSEADAGAPTAGPRPAPESRGASRAESPLAPERLRRSFVRIHDRVTSFFSSAEEWGRFRQDAWTREGGGGGVSRVLSDARTFEKAGVNRAAVSGRLEPEAAARLGHRDGSGAAPAFFATGVSVVAHPRSPMVPIVHMNVRYVEIREPGPAGGVADAWFGGGIDLTPTYPHPEDAVFFHRKLRAMCERYRADFYPRFKAECDRYFVNTHRDGEMRGVGGLFFDHLRPGAPDTVPAGALLRFIGDTARMIGEAYGPILERRRSASYGAREREFQLARRARYAEFNLIHDRGTRFGLETKARAESVLMSLPPLARWEYARSYAPDDFEARLLRMLRPMDWAEGLSAVGGALDAPRPDRPPSAARRTAAASA